MSSESAEPPWETLLPLVRGSLPLGGELRRTDPGGACPASIAIVGLYPALTKTAIYRCADGTRINVPVEVEARTFEGSKSAQELTERYLDPLGLSIRAVFTIDLYPYFLANTTIVGKKRRSMWANVGRYERETGTRTAVEGRPPADELVRRCYALPGNTERLAHFFGACRPSLVITLGNEVAAYVREYDVSTDAQQHLYGPPVTCTVFGISTTVVHCAHPGLFIRRTNASTNPWLEKHTTWCETEGRALVAAKMRSPR